MARGSVLIVLLLLSIPVWAQSADGIIPTQDLIKREDDPKKVVTTLEILFILTVLSMAPAILVMVTSFTRIVIVLSFVRRALATQELPPNNVIVSLSLILTVMVMMPTLRDIKRDAVQPYIEAKIPQGAAFQKAVGHLRTFMFRYTRIKDLKLFLDINGESERIKKLGRDVTEDDVPTSVLVPAFVISELRRAFIMGFALFLPFMVIDMVVASTLISMGMLVLPPILISLPFKILLFILVDGWHLIVGSLVQSFYTTG